MTNATSGWAVPGGAGQSPAPRRPQLVPDGEFSGHGHRQRVPDQTLTRPIYREPHKATGINILSGAGVAVLWFAVTALLGVDGTSRLWVTLVACLFASAACYLLARYGDRGVAAGVAVVTGVAAAVLGIVVGWPQVGHLISTVF